jgi:hypothetical protein
VRYTKQELKIIKDMSLSDEQVASQIGRSKQSIYCKRWAMKKKGFRARKPKSTVMYNNIVSENIIKQVVEKTASTAVERVILGNVTIDLVSKTLTIKF